MKDKELQGKERRGKGEYEIEIVEIGKDKKLLCHYEYQSRKETSAR